MTRVVGEPFRPSRGYLSNGIDWAVLILSSGLLVSLIFFVVDTVLLCRRFIENLSEKPTGWPASLLLRHAKARNMDEEHLDEWLYIQLIAKRTEVVGKFIYYPFIILFIVIIAHNNFFDHFDWPISLLLVFGINAAYAFYCAVALRQATEKARHEALKRLDEKLVKARGAGNEHSATTIQLTIEHIKAVNEGAFAPWSEQPFIPAVFLPFGVTGLLTLVQYLSSR